MAISNTGNSFIASNGTVNVFIIQNNGNIGIGNTSPGSKLTVSGLIESTSGGFKFPDGSTQNSAFSIGSSNAQVQYISNNTLSGSAGFVFVSSSNTLSVGNTINSNILNTNNINFNSISTIVSNTYSFSSSSPATIDTFNVATYRSAEYTIQLTDTSSGNQYEITKILITQDGTSTYMTEYGAIISSNILGNFVSSISGGNVNLQCTPYSANCVVKFTKILMVV